MDLTPEEKMGLFKSAKTKISYRAQHFHILIDEITLDTDRIIEYDIAVLPGASVMIPIDDDGRIIFIRQYRHPIRQIIIELPAGKIDHEEDPEITAGRELQEEIAKFPGKLEKICTSYPAPGYSTELLHFYVAKELTASKLPHDEFEAIESVHYSLEEALQMIKNGEIVDGKTVHGILMYEKSL